MAAKIVSLDTERRSRRLNEVMVARLLTFAGKPATEQLILDMLEAVSGAMHEFELADEPDPRKRFSLEKCRDLCRGPILEAAREVGVHMTLRCAKPIVVASTAELLRPRTRETP